MLRSIKDVGKESLHWTLGLLFRIDLASREGVLHKCFLVGESARQFVLFNCVKEVVDVDPHAAKCLSQISLPTILSVLYGPNLPTLRDAARSFLNPNITTQSLPIDQVGLIPEISFKLSNNVTLLRSSLSLFSRHSCLS